MRSFVASSAVTDQIPFHRKFKFSQLPNDWKVARVAVDWSGSPLVLIEEGKPPYPGDHAAMGARLAWDKNHPKAHHVIYWDGTSQQVVTFEKIDGTSQFSHTSIRRRVATQ